MGPNGPSSRRRLTIGRFGTSGERAKIWRDQILEHGYIGPETFYVVLCAPRTFYVCDLDGQLLETLHIESDHLTDPRTGDQFPLTDAAFRERMHIISYAASLERRQFEAFREGKLKSGHIPLTVGTLDQLQAVFSSAIERLRPYCRSHFRQLRDEYEQAKSQVAEVDRRLDIIGSGAVKTRQKLLYQRRTIRAKHRLAFQLFEDDYERFKHDQTYAGTQQEDHFEDIFCTNTAYVALSRLIFVRICEDVGLTTRKISNSGIAVWRDFVRNIKGNYQDLLDVAFKDVASVCPSLFESTIFPPGAARGAQPFGDLAGGGELGPEHGGERAERSVFLGRHAGPDAEDDLRPGERLDVVVAPVATARGRGPGGRPSASARARREARSRRCRAARPGRTVTIWRGAAARDVGHQRAGEGRLGRHEEPVPGRQRDGVAHQSRARRRGGPAGHLAAERRARGEHGPRCRVPHVGGERSRPRPRRRREPASAGAFQRDPRRRPRQLPSGRRARRVPGTARGRRRPPREPSCAAAPRSSSDTRCRPGSARTAITREAPRSAVRSSPGGGAAGPGRAVKAPRGVEQPDRVVDLRVERAVEDVQGARRVPWAASPRPPSGCRPPPRDPGRAGRRPPG